ncbi:sigma-70 family RNA polymerase sigma factor [Candidatus Poribacteria bacterium]|nr:sigma-70 family RNA polymerase sigma factor [Candidatus Poribacteria bacterium]
MFDDERLVQRCLNGEKEAFGALVDKYKNAVYGLAYRMVHKFHDAQDIGQEAFIDAYKNLRSLKYPHRFSSWIYTITANRCRMWQRKQAHDALAIASAEGVESKAMLKEQAIQQNRDRNILDAIRDAIDELPEASRLVVTLYYINGLTCKEIGEFTGTSINTVMSKLRRAREELRMKFTALPTPAVTQQRIHSGFTPSVLDAIKNLSPTPQPPSNPIGRIAWMPLATALIVGLLVMGTMPARPVDSRYVGWENNKLASINPFLDDGPTVSIIDSVQEPKPTLTPPATEENALYAAIASPESDADANQGGGLQYRLSPGDLWTYNVKMESINVRPTRNRVSHRVEGTHTLLVKAIEPDGLMQIANMTQENLIIPGPGRKPIPSGGIGLMFVKRNGRLDLETHRPDMDLNEYLKQMDLQKDPPVSILPISVGGNLLENPEAPYFVPFPSQPLKRGEVWNEKKSKYTVIGFENVNGYHCVILEHEQEVSSTKKVKARIACDTQSGMVVKLDGEIQTRKHAQQGYQFDTLERVTVELVRKEQLTQDALELERQALNRIGWALLEHRWVELDALRQKLENIRAQYPTIRLMPGLVGMIEDIDRDIAQRAKDAQTEYTYRDHLHRIAMLLMEFWEQNGKYTNRVRDVSLTPEQTPFYEYEVIDIEGTGDDAKCKIIAKGKKGTPAEGEAWVKILSASKGESEIQPLIPTDGR